jgi:hypothetical protein
MKRQQGVIEDIGAAFREAPEAASW